MIYNELNPKEKEVYNRAADILTSLDIKEALRVLEVLNLLFRRRKELKGGLS